jgi:DNA-binding MarR family transcriptional regulator
MKRARQDDPPDAVFEQVLISLRRIIRAIDLHSRLLLERHGLTGPQLVVLKALMSLGEVTVGELARRVHLSQATTTGVLTRLEKRGLITRTRSDIDRRRVLVRGTSAAVKLLSSAPPALQEQFLARFGELEDWEKSQILSSLQRVVSMMEADRIDATAMLVTGPIEGAESTGSTTASESGSP